MGSSVLIQSSPGVAALIRRHLGDAAVAVLSEAYDRAESLGGNLERGVIREEGVSFNPRMARVLTILLQDGEVRSLPLLRYSLQLGANKPQRESSEVGEGFSDAERALIAVAYALDRVRHLHMTTLPRAERAALLDSAERTLREASGCLPESVVLKKLAHSIDMQRRRLAAEEGAGSSKHDLEVG